MSPTRTFFLIEFAVFVFVPRSKPFLAERVEFIFRQTPIAVSIAVFEKCRRDKHGGAEHAAAASSRASAEHISAALGFQGRPLIGFEMQMDGPNIGLVEKIGRLRRRRLICGFDRDDRWQREAGGGDQE